MAMTTAQIGMARPANAGARASRSWGAKVGFSVAVVAALIAFGFNAPYLALGIPAATIAGWMLGPRIGPAEGVLGISVAMGAVTVAVADALVVVGLAGSSLASGTSDPLAMIGGGVVIWALGFVVVGIPMMAITVPCGAIWAVLVRAVARGSGQVESPPERDLDRQAA